VQLGGLEGPTHRRLKAIPQHFRHKEPIFEKTSLSYTNVHIGIR
jgi:hypothetical protein